MGTDTLIRPNYISIYEPPQAGFIASPTTGLVPLTVVFTDTSTGDIDTWSWDFGDGETSATQHPTHTYNVTGTFTVSLTVTGPGGSDAAIKTAYIRVGEGGVIANFSATPTSGVVRLTVNFTNDSMGEYDTCVWDFGDGDTSDQCLDPSHTYTPTGVYTISLTVSGVGGTDVLTRAKCGLCSCTRQRPGSLDGELYQQFHRRL
jgi:PKD repeat protein